MIVLYALSPFVVAFIGVAIHMLVAEVRHRRKMAEIEAADPLNEPEVQAMLREVMRTGRPMHMVRGEAPTFVGPGREPCADGGEK